MSGLTIRELHAKTVLSGEFKRTTAEVKEPSNYENVNSQPVTNWNQPYKI